MKIMKQHRYTVIDNKTNKKNHYSIFEWYLAFGLIFLFGFITGFIINYY